MVLYISASYRVLGIVCLDWLEGACHKHISYHDKIIKKNLTGWILSGYTGVYGQATSTDLISVFSPIMQ